MKRRRQLILAAGLAPLATPLAGLAQSLQQVRRIGTLSLSKYANEVAQLGRSMMLESLRHLGWEEGRNLVIDRRYAEGDLARLDVLALELVRLNVEVILTTLNPAGAAARRATNSMPIVIIGATLPVELGYVQSLAHPGGNVTGTVAPGPETAEKSIQILRELAPGLTRLALLFNPMSPGQQRFNAARTRAASELGMTVQLIPVTRLDDVTEALARIAASGTEMLLVSNDGVTEARLRDITSFAIQHKIVTMGVATLFTSVGGAIYYGSNLQNIIDRSMYYVDRILRGAKPADLPMEEPTKFDLILNLKTLRAIGITVPKSILLRATETIE